ncbi:hypothetical protein GH714_027397 [Hevea brasiliensis]|uniref:Phosphoglycerate mutase family protein n=1 Tax=Hevea brasiliensis TaxID=3981 RepID=A0A6A6MDS1_HEVBR|nr:hypothetical protein GH714_027397 [Hevea brasiliensis]
MEINAKATVAPSINSNLLMFLNSKPHLALESPVSVCCGCRRNPNARLRLSARCSSSATVTATVTEEESQQAPSKSVARRLILLRHAKSSWDNPSLRDHDRPLSKAGKDDAVQVSQKLQQLGWIPQLILSSDATRTRETLKIMQEQVTDLLDAEVHFIPSFYSIAAMDGQTADHLQQAICRYSSDKIHTVMCMGHNRGWEEAASMFTGASVELKPCNAALLEATGKSWEEPPMEENEEVQFRRCVEGAD